MTVKIDTDAEINSIRLKNQAGTPTPTGAGYSHLFTKGTGSNFGLYLEDNTGAIVGPFVTGTSQTGTSIQTITITQDIIFTPQIGTPTGTSPGKGKQTATGNDLYYVNPSGSVYLLTAPRMLLMSWDGVLYVNSGTSTARLYNRLGSTYTFQELFFSVGTPSTSASIIVDILKNGASIFSSKPTIPAGSYTGSSASFSVTTWTPGDYLTMCINQIGSGTAGSDLVAHIVIKQTA